MSGTTQPKPRIYATCKAGCQWETVHKDDLLQIISHFQEPIEQDGHSVLALGKEYKIFADKTNDTDFDCSLEFHYKSGSMETTYDIAIENSDEYAVSFNFRLLDAKLTNSSTITLVYEMAGTRYTETITGSNLSLMNTIEVILRGANEVYRYNNAEKVSFADFADAEWKKATTDAINAVEEALYNIEVAIDPYPDHFEAQDDKITALDERVSALEETDELLEAITTTEEIVEYRYVPADNGKKNIRAFRFYLEIPAATKSGNVRVGMRHKTYYTPTLVNNTLISTSKTYHNIKVTNQYGVWNAMRNQVNTLNLESQLYSICRATSGNEGNAESIWLQATEAVPFPVGTIIKLYGVEE